MIGKIIDFFIGKALFVITVKDSHDVAVLNILRERGFYDCSVQEQKITFACDCAKAKGISKNLDELGVPYDKSFTGLVCFVKRFFSRTGLLAGLIAVVILNALFSDIIWEIEIVGNKAVSDEDIMRGLMKFDIYEGSRKSEVDVKALSRDFMQSDDRLSFFHMNINGIKATVEVAEAVKKSPQAPDKKEVCNIVARCDGVIARMDVYSGGREVENGQSVVKGQLLVSSFFETRTAGLLLRRAKGTVLAQTQPCLEIIIPKVKYRKIPEKAKTQTSLSFLNYSIKLDGENVAFEKGNLYVNTQKTPMYLFGFLKLPVCFEKNDYSYSEYVEENRSEQEAKMIFEKEFERLVKRYNQNGEILSHSVETEETEDSYIFVCRLSCIESIGIDKPFEIREN